MKRIVTTHYRYKRPSRRRPTDLEANTGSSSANDNSKPTIVIASKPGKWRPDVPDMTTDEHRQRGDAADALFREIKRRIAAESATKKKP